MEVKRTTICILSYAFTLVHLSEAGNQKPFITTNSPITVREDMSVGSFVQQINATDIENDPLTFSIDSTGGEILEINGSTGVLTLKKKLNREIKYDYTFNIFVADNYGGDTRKEGKVFILIVGDANDNAPIFLEQPYLAKVSENATIGTSLIKISAIDADLSANAQVRYKFSNSSQTTKFKIHHLNGIITLRGSLDYETTQTYLLRVIAEDLGSPKQQTTTTVIIEVTDISDMPPRFIQSTYLKEINENVAVGTTVVAVEARDGDAGINNPIKYEIVSGNDGTFVIDSNTGKITVNGTIDAEKIDLYRIKVRATEVPDPSSNATVVVMITVLDQNDNAPVFPKSSYVFEVREDVAKPGRIVTDQLNVKDGDKNPDFRRFKFYLTGGDSDKFSIDPTSGILKINRTLDYETQVNYTFTIVVTETGTAELFSANASATLILVNVNDNKPIFAQASYNYTFNEEVSANTLIADVTATDADRGSFGKLTYELRGGQSAFFQVNSQNGSISTKRTLDYEQVTKYQFHLIAKDGGGFYEETGTTEITVILIDVNDNDPVFSGTPYTRDISENLPAGTSVFTVIVTDRDSGENGRVSLNIMGGNVGNAFVMNSSGVITTTKELDREDTGSYSLTIMAFDHGTPRRNSSTILRVQVLDKNDNTPVITRGSYIVTNISEGAGGGTVLLQFIEARDPDAGSNGRLTYSMSGGDSRFTLNSDTGQLQISPTGLDREQKSSYDLVINVTDHGTPPRQNSTIVHVNILDINDNTPVFIPEPTQSLATYIKSLDEGPGTINTTVIDINATDSDHGVNALIRYTLSGDGHGFFRIDSETGVVSVRKELDRESPQMTLDANGNGRFLLDITATDQAMPESDRKAATVKVTITVMDINDNSPQFQTQIHNTRISEAARPGSNVIQVTASDKDLEYKGKVTYNITAGDPHGRFEIAPNGMIQTKTSLDADQVSVYNLTVVASDGGSPPLTTTTYAVINVDDVNDNDPIFNPSAYTARVGENVSPGTYVVKVNASDKDLGANGNITFKLTGGNRVGSFRVDNITGVISTAGVIDREKVQSYTLTVQAEDLGQPSSRKAFAEVIVTVVDENDNYPQFSSSSFEAKIAENSAAGITVTPNQRIFATDDDTGNNAVITYSLTGAGAHNFYINMTTGIITTSINSSLDRERNSSYHLTITATDGGNKNTSIPLTITVTDQNDESPRFSHKMYYANVTEDAKRGTTIRRVTATDLDTGLNSIIIYTSNGAEAKFYVSRSSGDIIVDSSLDREYKSVYILNVTAANIVSGAHETTTQVHITITDVIDDKPYFSANTLTVRISENASIGTNITKITALDKDIGDTLSYVITRGDTYGLFRIDNITGELFTAKELDRENSTEHAIYIEAKDSVNLKSDHLKVVIQVEDVNDNAPKFTKDSLKVDYWEESPAGTSILKVKATDLDSGQNAQIRYSIVENVTNYVTVDAVTGVVTLGSSQLDREVSPYFNFTIKATDLGIPSKSSTAEVSIRLVDINDNRPIFNKTDYYAYVRENLPPGSPVLVLTATDKDIGTNAQLSYGVSGSMIFHINPDTGNITTREALNREEPGTSSYTLTVRAVDGAIRAREGTTRVIVTVLDANDHAPVFSQPSYSMDVKEDVAIGYSVGRVFTTDNDINQNARVSYYISSGNTKPPTWTNSAIYSWPLDSVNKKYIRGSTRGVTRGNMTQVPGPGISALLFNGMNSQIDLGTFPGRCISDPGKCINGLGVVVWLKLDSTAYSYSRFSRKGFVLSSGGEQASARGVVVFLEDRRLFAKVSLVNATWTCNSSFTIDKWMLVVISWRNDTGIRLYINETLAASQIEAEKSSSSHEKDLLTHFFIGCSSGPQPNHARFSMASLAVWFKTIGLRDISRILTSGLAFSVNETSGIITTISTLDRETNASFTITITARDHGVPPLQRNTSVTITINDVNDNKPTFTQSRYNATLRESAFLKTRVTQVLATDPDKGANGQFTYQIAHGDTDNVFNLDAQTGLITLKNKLDHEVTPRYNLTVIAKDLGSPSLTGIAFVIVTVTDVDDNAPVFHQEQYSTNIYENSTRGDVVLQVNATDIDAHDDHKTIYYRLESGNIGNMFVIGELNGTIMLNCTSSGCLDRETRSRYDLKVAAISRVNQTEQKALVPVVVNVLDVNDVTPIFVPSSYSKSVREDTGDITGQDNVLLTVSARDNDIGINSELIYTIESGNERGVFALDNKTGVLTKLIPLDRENTTSYELVVKVTDKGTPPLYSNTTIRITVLDVNDNQPQFEAQASFLIPENATVGTLITQLTATDKDSGLNSVVYFFIISGNENRAFELNETSGELKTAETLDRETTSRYKMIIKAQDRGSPRLSSERGIDIILIDLNDNKPIFPVRRNSLSVDENLPAGALVGRITAQDLDDKNPIYYYIRNVEEKAFFKLNETSGLLKTTVKLDRESGAFHYLYVKASNERLNSTTLTLIRARRSVSEPSSNTTNATAAPLPADLTVQLVVVAVGDSNDNGPTFSKKVYTGGVSDNAKHGSNVLRVIAYDADSGNNSRIAYSLLPGLDSAKFSIDIESGWIKAKDSYAGKMGQEYVMNIIAKDNFGQQPYFNDTATVKIYVLTDHQRAVLISGRLPDEVRANIEEFISVLQNLTGYIINIDDINYYKNGDKYDYTRTAVLFHAVDPKTKKIVDRDTVIKKIDQNYHRYSKFFTEWKIKEVKPQVPDPTPEEFPLVLAAVIGLSILLTIVICIFCCVVCQLRKREKAEDAKLQGARAREYLDDVQQQIQNENEIHFSKENGITNISVDFEKGTWTNRETYLEGAVIDDTKL